MRFINLRFRSKDSANRMQNKMNLFMKREMYYGKKFESREELEKAITEYIDYYTNDRPQRGLGVLRPMEFHEKQRLAA